MTPLGLALVILGTVAVYVSGAGAAAWWAAQAGSPPPLAQGWLVSAGLHLAWVGSAACGRSHLLVLAGFPTSVWLCRRGFLSLSNVGSPLVAAFLLQGLVLLLAFSFRPPLPPAARLARWRRTLADIETQLRMTDGLASWTHRCLRHLCLGQRQVPLLGGLERLPAELAEVESRLGTELVRVAAPESLRQFLQSAVADLATEAERICAAAAEELERRTLALAAACRERCDDLPDLSPEKRAQLARQCEQVLVETLTAHSSGLWSLR